MGVFYRHSSVVFAGEERLSLAKNEPFALKRILRVLLAARPTEELALPSPLLLLQLHEPFEAMEHWVLRGEDDTDAAPCLPALRSKKGLGPCGGLEGVLGAVASGSEELVFSDKFELVFFFGRIELGVSEKLPFRIFGGCTHLLVSSHQVEVVPTVIHDVDLAAIQEGRLAHQELDLFGEIEEAERLSGGRWVDRRRGGGRWEGGSRGDGSWDGPVVHHLLDLASLLLRRCLDGLFSASHDGAGVGLRMIMPVMIEIEANGGAENADVIVVVWRKQQSCGGQSQSDPWSSDNCITTAITGLKGRQTNNTTTVCDGF